MTHKALIRRLQISCLGLDPVDPLRLLVDDVVEALAQQEQEPVATDWERIARVQNAKLMAMCNEAGGFEKLCEVMDKYEKTTQPQRTWVGLTDEEYKELHLQMGPVYYYQEYGQAIEAKLKERNT